ncbi:hypothetical protein XELAEV_18026761mg [Xenopus laevis]|uniref:Uncharacterized protein n=1 Tax=Xenopus laevis TaxID=8355 RepID=A0A974CWL1_XENLA|nr:hypothetical protein XELAEV_18026761mg [Xenopus laevis]
MGTIWLLKLWSGTSETTPASSIMVLLELFPVLSHNLNQSCSGTVCPIPFSHALMSHLQYLGIKLLI